MPLRLGPSWLPLALVLSALVAGGFALVAFVVSSPSALIGQDGAPAVEPPSTDSGRLGLPADLEARIGEMLERSGTDGLAVTVVRGEEILLARGFGQREETGEPYTATSVHGLFSATKALTSFVVASLVEDDLLDLEAPLGALIGAEADVEVADRAPVSWAPIPFWRLLNHTSGIPTIVDRPEFEALAADPTSTNRDVYEIVRALPLDYAPGTASRYRQSGYAVAEMNVAQRLERSWPELVEAHVTTPAVMVATRHAHLASGERTAPLLTSAGFYQTNADDLARLFRALGDGRIVDPAFLEQLLYTEEYVFRDAGEPGGYSLGSILEEVDGVRTVGHRGGGARATIRYAPSRRVGVAVLTDDTSNDEVAIEVADLLLRAVLEPAGSRAAQPSG